MRVGVTRKKSGLLVAETSTIGFSVGEIVDVDLEVPEPAERAAADALSKGSVTLSRYYGETETQRWPERAR